MNVKQAHKVFQTPVKMKISRAVKIAAVFFLYKLGVEGILNKTYAQDRKSKATSGQVSQDTAKMVVCEASLADSVAKNVNAMLEKRGVVLRAGKYVSSFPMPASDKDVEVLNAKGEKLTTLDEQELAVLRKNGFKCPIGSYIYVYSGGKYAHVFEKANSP